MSITILSKHARRFLSQRLERLQQTLEGLGQRLRESIAAIVGSQIGEAIRDALETILQREPVRPSSWHPRSDTYSTDRGGYPERHWYEEDEDLDDGYWQNREPQPSQARSTPEPEATSAEQKPARWKSLLTGLVQVVGCWIQHAPKRPPLRRFLGLGLVVGASTLVAGPIVGGVVMTMGTALLLTRLSDGFTQAVSQLVFATTH